MPRRAKAPASLEIRLLGPFRVSVDGSPVEERQWSRRKPQQILKLLALAPHHELQNEQIMDLLWPELEPSAAANNLTQSLYVARRALEPGLASGACSHFLVGHGDGVVLRAPARLWIDVEAFESLAAEAMRGSDAPAHEAALDLYRGDLLTQDPYVDWAATRRDQLRGTRRDLLLRLVDLHERRGEMRKKVECLRTIVTAEPSDEESHRQLMRLYALTGKRSQALAQYRQCCDALRREIDAEPDESTLRLHEEIAAGRLQPLIAKRMRPKELPRQATSFVGRKEEIAEAKRALASQRLLTLTGPGGVGKTRLALRVADELSDRYSDGVWFVDLAALGDPALVAQSVAGVLGVAEQRGRPLSEAISESLRHRQLLLVLDNCEHLVEACAPFVEHLLSACPGLAMLVTSREALGLPGEIVRNLPPLSIPSPVARTGPGAVAEYEAVRLFLDRVMLANPSFALTEHNASALATLCRRLDGMPLAIEMAAGRARVLSIEQMLAKLDQGLGLLAGSDRTAVPRQRTLWATIDWSYGLLSEQERTLARRLSIFSGGWDLDAAEAICVGHGIQATAVLDLLTHLIDKSLVVSEQRGADTRYRMLETIRQYARDKLDASGEAGLMRDAHGDWFLLFAERAQERMAGSQQSAWAARVEVDLQNLRHAFRWAIDQEKAEVALRLCCALGRFWSVTGCLSEGRMWVDEALSISGAARTPLRATALFRGGDLALVHSDIARGKAMLEQSLALSRELDYDRGVADALRVLAVPLSVEGDFERATAVLQESLALNRRLDQRTGIAFALYGLGKIAMEQGQYVEASHWYEESLAMYRALNDGANMAGLLQGLGDLAHRQGDYQRAMKLSRESLALAQEAGYRRLIKVNYLILGYAASANGNHQEAMSLLRDSLILQLEMGDREGVVQALEGVACALAAHGAPDRALVLAGAASDLRGANHCPISPSEQLVIDRYLSGARQALGEGGAEQALSTGRAMTMEQAVARAMEEGDAIIE